MTMENESYSYGSRSPKFIDIINNTEDEVF